VKPTSSVQPGSARTPAQKDAAERKTARREEYTVTVSPVPNSGCWAASVRNVTRYGVDDADALMELASELLRWHMMARDWRPGMRLAP